MSETQDYFENAAYEKNQVLSMQGKWQSLQTMGAYDYIKDKVTKSYLMQIQNVQVRSKMVK